MVTTVAIIGGSLPGLIAAWVFRQHPKVKVRVFESSRIGGTASFACPEILNHTEPAARLLRYLDVPCSSYRVTGGVLLRGRVHPYPEILSDLDEDAKIRIGHDYFTKTRMIVPEADHVERPLGVVPKRRTAPYALRFVREDLVEALARGVDVNFDRVDVLGDRELRTLRGDRHSFDFAISTLPLWNLERIARFAVPPAIALRRCATLVQPVRDWIARWDYVLTPYTPERCVYALRPIEGAYLAEASGDVPEASLVGDLSFLFREGFFVRAIEREAVGHLLPLPYQPEFPERVAPLGRFAEWDYDETLDGVLARAYALLRHWFGGFGG